MHILGTIELFSFENIDVCEARIGHQILPYCNGNLGLLLISY